MNLPLWIRILPLLLLMSASPALAADEAKRLTALIDYIGGDYKNAVQEGKVVNPDEYQEMLEFSTRSTELFKQLKAGEGRDAAGIEKDLHSLASHIEQKSDHNLVSGLAQQIKARLIAAYRIVTYPKSLPHLQAGRNVYAQNCAQCHGETGRGDGPSAATMQPKEPKPANFTDRDLMQGLSPFKAFNTTSFGIEGTAMANFSALSEDERWQVAFYIFSLRFSDAEAKQGKALLETKKLPGDLTGVAALAALSDEELKKKLQPHLPSRADRLKVSAYLRRGLLEEKKPDPLLTARTLLKDSMTLYEKGQTEKAYQKAVEAYLDGFELAEPVLFARDASFGRSLEARFTRFRTLIKAGADVDQVRKLHNEVDTELIRASQLSTGENSLTGGYLFLNAALIILREGLEAALVLAAIFALLKVMGANDAARYIHLGWILAVAAGILTWFLSSTVLALSGAQRETMEGLVTLFAALVLFYVGYWLHTKSEAKKWQQFIQAKVQEALSTKGILALVGVSFFAVYREAFEVVLFYQALWLQSPDSPTLVIWGFVAGLAVLTVLVFALLKLGLKMPLKYFFGAAGALLYLLAFVMAGKGVKALQAAGWFSETPLQHLPQIPFLGIYPTLETVVAQGVLLLALIAALFTLAREHRYEVTSH